MDETRDPFGGDRTMNEGDRLPAGHALPGAETRAGDSPIHNTGADVSGGTSAGADANDPDATRAEIEQTRARMSETIDEIEEQLLRRKQTIEEKLDVKAQVREKLAPVREKLVPIQEQVDQRPIVVFGGVFGAGLLLGYLTGGDEDKKARRAAALSGSESAEYESEHRIRARRWEEQSRRLMKQNAEQEEEMRRLRSRLEVAEREAARAAERGEGESRSGWRRSLGSAIGGVFGGLLGQIRGQQQQEEEYDVEVEVRATGPAYDRFSPSTASGSGSYRGRPGTGYSESQYGGTGAASSDYPQRGFSQGAHYDAGLEDGGYTSSPDYSGGYSSEYDEGDEGYGPGNQLPG